MEKCQKVAALYIATLQALAIILTQSHWLTRGTTFYGDHLLFERIYDSALDDLDAAAEKLVGIFGDEVLNYELQAELLNKVLLRFKNLEGSPLEMSLAIEKDFLKFSQSAYDCFKEEEKMTLGVDDLIMSIASNRETSVYRIQQALKGSEK
jgi:DNA-binding ferritin-like protein